MNKKEVKWRYLKDDPPKAGLNTFYIAVMDYDGNMNIGVWDSEENSYKSSYDIPMGSPMLWAYLRIFDSMDDSGKFYFTNGVQLKIEDLYDKEPLFTEIKILDNR